MAISFTNGFCNNANPSSRGTGQKRPAPQFYVGQNPHSVSRGSFFLNKLVDMYMKNTLISVWRIICFAAILALTGCAATPTFETFSHKAIKHPAPLATSTAAKGQPVYLHYDYDSLIVYRLQEPLDMRLGIFGAKIVGARLKLPSPAR